MTKRDNLHDILADVLGLVCPEEYPDLVDRINAAICMCKEDPAPGCDVVRVSEELEDWADLLAWDAENTRFAKALAGPDSDLYAPIPSSQLDVVSADLIVATMRRAAKLLRPARAD